jgi:hypothetical protein
MTSHRAVTAFLNLCLGMVAFGCGLSGLTESEGPLNRPELLTPVAVAQEAGVTLYWLGEQFEVGSLLFQIAGGAELINRSGNGPGLEFEYSAAFKEGSVGLNLGVFSEQSGEADALREAVLEVTHASFRDARVGSWEGELHFLPAGTRPVNQLLLFVDVGETIILGRALSGSSGIPGEDSNPLIQADLLIEVMAEHLRPYPE